MVDADDVVVGDERPSGFAVIDEDGNGFGLLRGIGPEGGREREEEGREKERVGTHLLHVLTVTRFAPAGRVELREETTGE